MRVLRVTPCARFVLVASPCGSGAVIAAAPALPAAAEDGAAVADAAAKLSYSALTKYFLAHTMHIPEEYISTDTNRMTVLYFALSALDILGGLPLVKNKDVIIRWVYSQQVPSRAAAESNTAAPSLPDLSDHQWRHVPGFVGGTSTGRPFTASRGPAAPPGGYFDTTHSAMSYTALCILHILGDDLSGVDRSAIVASLKLLQQPDGCFLAVACGGETDMRFLYCACTISTLLHDWSGVDVSAALRFIQSCQTYEGGFGLHPGSEAHGGSTFCALASLSLMGQLHQLQRREELLHWLVTRQNAGFHGRCNKVDDTCYSYWVGGSLAILKELHLVDAATALNFLVTCQDNRYGGLSKYPHDEAPDILHAYFGLCGVAMLSAPNPHLARLDPTLGLAVHTRSRVDGWRP